MNTNELLAELSIKMLELEKAIDLGMPYDHLKEIYYTIKALQFQIACEESQKPREVHPESNDYVIE